MSQNIHPHPIRCKLAAHILGAFRSMAS
jgi:site-specific recombinase XerC